MMSETEWRQALASCHPDRGGDIEQYKRLVSQRAVWRLTQPGMCQYCGRSFMGRKSSHGRSPQRYCSSHCACKARGKARRGSRLKGINGRPGRKLKPRSITVI